MSGRKINHTGGFSLIELLVALTLFGILAASMAGVLRNTSDSVEQGREALDNLARMRSIDLLLGSALREADVTPISQRERQLLSSMDADYDPAYGTFRFRGESRSLGFCMPRPFTCSTRDGYLHWITLEVREETDEGPPSLWLRDVSFLRGVDNPAGEAWEGTDLNDDYTLPTQEFCLIKEAVYIAFRFMEKETDGMTGDDEPVEMEPEDIEGDYARILPDFIELDIRLPRVKMETLTFEWNAKGAVL